MYYINKPKIFVRFYPGASGNFFSLFLHALAQDVDELSNDQYGAHIDHSVIKQGHNFEEQLGRDLTLDNEFDIQRCINEVFNVGVSVSRIKDNCKFTETPNAIYTIPTHSLHPANLIAAFPINEYNTRLINIQHSYSDIPQISYNMVTKSVIPWRRIDYVKEIVSNVLKQYPEKAKNPKFNIDDTVFEDVRFLCYLYKHSLESPESFYPKFLENTIALANLGISHFNVPFDSMTNLSLISNIDSLIDYLGIESTPNRKKNAIELLTKYAGAQKENPYKDLHIDDY